jgi:hypothetical protein
MSEELQTVFECKTPGIAGAKTFIRRTGDIFESRQAVSIFGSYQMPEDELEKIDYNPFHEDFNDNCVKGKGSSEDAAIKAMEFDIKSLHESLWF